MNVVPVRYASLLEWRCIEWALCWSGTPACWTGGVLRGLCVGQVRQPAGPGQAAVY